MRRWTNVRDSFAKSCKKQKETKKSGSGVSRHKKYVYNDQLKFLSKLYTAREIEENFEDDGWEHDADVNLETHPERMNADAVNPNPELVTHSRKRRKPDELEIRMLKVLEGDKPNRHLSFFHSIMPALEKFDEHEVLDFQMGVLQLISNMNKKKMKASQPPSFFSQPTLVSQSYFYPQPQGHESRPTQSAAQYYQNFGEISATNSPVSRPSESVSPAQSTSSYNSVDFAAMSSV